MRARWDEEKEQSAAAWEKVRELKISIAEDAAVKAAEDKRAQAEATAAEEAESRQRAEAALKEERALREAAEAATLAVERARKEDGAMASANAAAAAAGAAASAKSAAAEGAQLIGRMRARAETAEAQIQQLRAGMASLAEKLTKAEVALGSSTVLEEPSTSGAPLAAATATAPLRCAGGICPCRPQRCCREACARGGRRHSFRVAWRIARAEAQGAAAYQAREGRQVDVAPASPFTQLFRGGGTTKFSGGRLDGCARSSREPCTERLGHNGEHCSRRHGSDRGRCCGS